MATGQKLYPRANLKKIVKAHSKRNLTKNVDVLVCFTTRSGLKGHPLIHEPQIFLDYMLFLETYVTKRSILRSQLSRNIV